MRAPAYSDGIHSVLVPTFRSSYTISAITFCELRKAMGTSKFMILVPLFDLKSLGSFRRLRCRDFKSAALVDSFRAAGGGRNVRPLACQRRAGIGGQGTLLRHICMPNIAAML